MYTPYIVNMVFVYLTLFGLFAVYIVYATFREECFIVYQVVF